MKTHIGKGEGLRAKWPRKRQAFWAFVVFLAMLSLNGCVGNNSSSSSIVTVSVATETVRAGETTTFTAAGPNAGGGQWIVVGGAKNGSIDKNGLYHAPDSVPQPNTVSIGYTVAGKSYTHSVQILNPIPTLSGAAPNILQMAVSTIVITGNKFVVGSTVLVNGQAVPTTFVSSTNIQAAIAIPQQTTTALTISVANPEPGSTTSAAITLPVALQPLSITPSVVTGGPLKLQIANIGASPDLGISVDDRLFDTAADASNSSVTATGFLPPWHEGTATVRIFSRSTSTKIGEVQLPIAQTATSFDAAARFLTQAGFGPRQDLVQHVQAVGFDAFIAEQQAIPSASYSSNDGGIISIMERSVLGSNPLRLRVAWALQTFLMRAGISQQVTNFPFEEKMERDATGNFRDLLTDISSDVSIAQMLTLAGNAAPSDPTQHPNQNFARELLQLFTIGTSMLNEDGTIQTNPDGSPIPAYDQNTILDLSRVFTGWNYAPPVNPRYTFYGADWSQPLVANQSQHDKGQKTLFGNVTLPAGQTAEQDRAMALDAIFAHPNVPPFISRILIQRLVKSDPSPDYVKRISVVFKDNGKGIRGDLSAVVSAILLDPEARSGDSSPSPSDGFLQEPYLFETFAMNIIGWTGSDAQPSYIPCSLQECVFYSTNVFGFYSPSYRIPGTTINSPEFQILNDVTLVNRSQVLWGMLTGQQGGFQGVSRSSWIVENFSTIEDLVDALNHLAYHGQMSKDEQQFIINYCHQLQTNDPLLPKESAIFLALNADNYTVAH